MVGCRLACFFSGECCRLLLFTTFLWAGRGHSVQANLKWIVVVRFFIGLWLFRDVHYRWAFKSSCFQLFHYGFMKEALGKIMENWRVACSDSSGRDSDHSLCDKQLRMGICWCRCQVDKHPTPSPKFTSSLAKAGEIVMMPTLWLFIPSKFQRCTGWWGRIGSCFAFENCNIVCRCYDYMFNGNMLVCFVDVKSLCFRSSGGNSELLQFVQMLEILQDQFPAL